MINRLPDEVLLEIFDSYRQNILDSHLQGVDQYDHQWRNKYAWFNLAHVCRRWRSVVFASSSRLDLNVIVGPEKPNHIKTILSGHLPILIDYLHFHQQGQGDITDSALWRMRAVLRHRDRVRGISISFRGGRDDDHWHVIFEKFMKATSYYFPALDNLVLSFPSDPQVGIPATFLRGPDQLHLPLRRLRLDGVSFGSVSGLLLSATALTDLTLNVAYNAAGLDSSQGVGSFLVACLQSMKSLRSLDLYLTTGGDLRLISQHPTPKDIVPLLKLTRFHYSGPTMSLNTLMSGISAPSLKYTRFILYNRTPLLHFSRLIDDVTEEFRSVSVAFDVDHFRLLSSTHSGKIDHFNPSFRFHVNCSPDSIKSINATPSTKLAMAQELALIIASRNLTRQEDVFSLGEFLRQFRSVRVLRLNQFMQEVGLYLQQDNGEAMLPQLEEIELITCLTGYTDQDYQRRVAQALAAFEPFVSARERAGRIVKVYLYEY
jgi:hypothetical protein